MIRYFYLAALLFTVSCTTTTGTTETADKDKIPLTLKAVSYSALPDWQMDQHEQALIAFQKSCGRILKKDAAQDFGPDGIGGTFGDWQPLCRAAKTLPSVEAKAFFEQNFTPYEASFAGRETEGLFTGYYEASLNGSRTKHGAFQYPLRVKPADLVMVDLGEFRDELKGQRIAGRVIDGRLKPYEDRAQIISGVLDNKNLAFVWVDDPVDAFFLHIQGSGRVMLDDGTSMRVGYAGQNGHPYYAIGRELIRRGHLEKEEVSLQSIRAWLEANPDQAMEVMNTNKSYVFLHELKEEGPLGGENVSLTPERSLAIDRSKIPYGVPVWLAAEPPVVGEDKLRRLMVAQDTGGAIRGAVRGDVFWGHGDRATYLAGQMKSKGRYWLLLPTNKK